jgi:putative sugar O-methyltransferase
MNDFRDRAEAPPMQNAPMLKIADDEALLALMLRDAARQPQLYQPGPYWRRKAKNTTAQIRRLGIGDFRGMSSTIGLSFTDSIHLDVRHDLSGGVRSLLRVMLNSVFPVNRVFEAQIALARAHEAEARRLRGIVLGANQRVQELAARYRIPPSLLGGCLNYVDVAGHRIATHYLNLLHQHDVIAESCCFSDVASILEIGGGFGAHVHCLIENYPKLRKIVYLDIPPNLYIGTQYLRAFYGAAVVDYRQTRELSVISFSDNDALEILALTPWQIERLRLSVDVLYNAHSFVEMPAHVVANYARHVAALPGFERTRVVMLSYDNFDPRTTLDPERLPGFFPSKSFDRREFPLPDRSYGVISFVSRPSSTSATPSRP